MTSLRIVFMGTPAFALPALRRLYSDGYPLMAVVTQPDRPAGRGQKEVASPVKHLAGEFGLTLLQPVKVKDPSFLETFYALKPDMVVVAAFGQILPKAMIDFPRFGCLNIHPSLLPKYRGAAPLNWSIIRGETTTGVTIMQMDEGMDSGDILAQEETPLGQEETVGDLHDRLATLGARLLIRTIDEVVAGQAARRPQDISQVTFAPRLTRETGQIHWSDSAIHIVNLVRGLSPTPAAYTRLDGQPLKIFAAAALPGRTPLPPGTIGEPVAEGLPVAASDGVVLLKDVQLASKKRMPVSDFLRGYQIRTGSVLG